MKKGYMNPVPGVCPECGRGLRFGGFTAPLPNVHFGLARYLCSECGEFTADVQLAGLVRDIPITPADLEKAEVLYFWSGEDRDSPIAAVWIIQETEDTYTCADLDGTGENERIVTWQIHKSEKMAFGKTLEECAGEVLNIYGAEHDDHLNEMGRIMQDAGYERRLEEPDPFTLAGWYIRDASESPAGS